MNPFTKIIKHLVQNAAEYYTLLTIVVFIPAVIAAMFGLLYGLFVSFVLQAVIGISYIRNSDERTRS